MPPRVEELGHDWLLMYWSHNKARIRHRHSPDLNPIYHRKCPNCHEQVPDHIVNVAKLLLVGEPHTLEI